MRLPRRHPFTSHAAEAELLLLRSLLYPPNTASPQEADSLRCQGVHLVQSLYLAKGGCPVAIECTAALVAAQLLDHQVAGNHGPHLTPPPAVSLAIRHSLTLSLIRLVNTLADAMQKGAFARSIASIAENQLGLPQWFVEFRHRGTHEELPSLEICREVVGSALAWIEGAYWLPTVRELERRRRRISQKEEGSRSHHIDDSADAFESPRQREMTSPPYHHGSSSTNPPLLLFPTSKSQPLLSTRTPAERLSQDHLPSLCRILGKYKRLSKLLVRDQSLQGRRRHEVRSIYGEVDEWIRSARRDVGDVGEADGINRRRTSGRDGRLSSGWNSEEEDDEGDSEENGSQDVILASLIRLLLSPDEGVGLIPLSKNKRAKRSRGEDAEDHEALPSLPEELLSAWSGLLNHLAESYRGDSHSQRPGFVKAWLEGMLAFLREGTLDASSRLTILAWIKVVLESLSPAHQSSSGVQDPTSLLRRNIQLSLTGHDGDAQSYLLTLAQKLLLLSSEASAPSQSSLASLLKDITARLDEDVRPKLEVLIQMIPSFTNSHGGMEGDDGLYRSVESERKKRRMSDSKGEDPPLLAGFEQMDSRSHLPRTSIPTVDIPGVDDTKEPSEDPDMRTQDDQSNTSMMQEMERRWKQVLASSSSSSSMSPTSTPTRTREIPPSTRQGESTSLPLSSEEEESSRSRVSLPPIEDDGALLSIPYPRKPDSSSIATSATPQPQSRVNHLPKGWTLPASEERWNPIPIGMLRVASSQQDVHEKDGGDVGLGSSSTGGGEKVVVPDFFGLN